MYQVLRDRENINSPVDQDLMRVFLVLFLFIYLFIYLWLCWVFVSVHGLSLVVASGGHSSSRCTGLSCGGAQAPDAQAQ